MKRTIVVRRLAGDHLAEAYEWFYVIEGEFVVVAAIYHLARDPRSIRENLEP